MFLAGVAIGVLAGFGLGAAFAVWEFTREPPDPFPEATVVDGRGREIGPLDRDARKQWLRDLHQMAVDEYLREHG